MSEVDGSRSFIDRVWRKIQAHNEKFADIDLVEALVQLPEHDGDIAYLHELADKILAANPHSLDAGDGLIEYGIDLFLPPWPQDRAEAELVDWATALRDSECEWTGWLTGWAEAVAA